MTVAAPPMSARILSILPAGLIEIPPVSKVTPCMTEFCPLVLIGYRSILSSEVVHPDLLDAAILFGSKILHQYEAK